MKLVLLALLFSCYTFGQTPVNIGLYKEAEKEIMEMLNKQRPRDLKRAIFLVENAYSGGELNYNDFVQKIEAIKGQLSKIITDNNLSKNPLAKNYAIYTYMKTACKYNNGKTYEYDFEDFIGNENWKNMFVTKLLTTNKGNCHSLPLLYKLLAFETKAEAYLAFAPIHMYIKHKDDKNQWLNVELTSGTFPSDSWIISESEITAEAIKSGIYMAPLTETETFAYCLEYLALTYCHQNGEANYVTKLCNKALKYYPNLVNALILKSNVLEAKIRYVDKEKIYLQKKDTIKNLIAELQPIYDKIDGLGYKKASKETYEKWMRKTEEEKNRLRTLNK